MKKLVLSLMVIVFLLSVASNVQGSGPVTQNLMTITHIYSTPQGYNAIPQANKSFYLVAIVPLNKSIPVSDIWGYPLPGTKYPFTTDVNGWVNASTFINLWKAYGQTKGFTIKFVVTTPERIPVTALYRNFNFYGWPVEPNYSFTQGQVNVNKPFNSYSTQNLPSQAQLAAQQMQKKVDQMMR
jgi:hypothetical protein